MTQCSFCGVDGSDLFKNYLQENNLKEENLTQEECNEIHDEIDQERLYFNPEYDLGHCQLNGGKCGDKYEKEVERIHEQRDKLDEVLLELRSIIIFHFPKLGEYSLDTSNPALDHILDYLRDIDFKNRYGKHR